jgi:drug/metabolite transporter (DMT)-like permease
MIDGWTANGWRYGFSALLWLPVLLLSVRRGTFPGHLWKAALLPSFFNAVAQIAFGLAPYYVEPGLMAFSLRLQIVFVTVGAAFLFAAERKVIKSVGFIVGISMVILGTFATILLSPKGLGGGTGFGIGLAICSGLLYACYALSVRAKLHGTDPLLSFSVVSQYTALVMVGAMLVFARDKSGAHDFGMQVFSLSGYQLFLLLLSSVIGIGIGHTLYFKSLQILGLAVSAGVVQLQPITVSVASIFIFNEHLTWQQWCTGALAVCGAGVMLTTQHLAAKRARQAPIDELDNLPVDEDVALIAQSNVQSNVQSNDQSNDAKRY